MSNNSDIQSNPDMTVTSDDESLPPSIRSDAASSDTTQVATDAKAAEAMAQLRARPDCLNTETKTLVYTYTNVATEPSVIIEGYNQKPLEVQSDLLSFLVKQKKQVEGLRDLVDEIGELANLAFPIMAAVARAEEVGAVVIREESYVQMSGGGENRDGISEGEQESAKAEIGEEFKDVGPHFGRLRIDQQKKGKASGA